ncbi:tyrosine-protein kinase [Dyadobacter sp. NIV53]|uniref:GumC family protein n=1 Tax=Dyadobacter sp. NIV53 TaxID=2861765 RepID=UPI001C87EB57|nr:tyrosine-protein kinase [Dyadobacter sp. NIV53]
MSSNRLENVTATLGNPGQNELLIRKLWQLLYKWYWFALSLVICLCIRFIFLRYTTPKYEIHASILVKDDTKGTDSGEAALLEGLGLSSGKSNVDNEVEILKSRTLMESVVKDLQLYVQYFASGHVKTTEIYDKSPILLTYVDPEAAVSIHHEITYYLSFGGKNRFTLTDNIQTWNQAFGDTFHLPTGYVVLTRTAFKLVSEDTYSIKVTGVKQTVNKFSQELSVLATNKLVSIIDLKLTDILPSKGEILLEKLIENYLHTSITDKNRIADSTIAFINQNLKLVLEELTDVEKQIEEFRTRNQVTDINEQTKLLLNNYSQYDKERVTNKVQLKVIESLLAFITENPTKPIPSSIVMQEAGFILMVEQYNTTQLSHERASAIHTSEHPGLQSLDIQLRRMRDGLISDIESRRKELQLKDREIKRYTSGFQSQIDHIPAKERVFLDYTRKQEIKQELYIFLLKKRIETSISKSSTLANGRVIDPAKADDIPITPNKQLTLILALLLALCIPITVFYTIDIFNTTITDKSDVMDLVDLPILAEIGHNQTGVINIIHQNNRGQIAEQFRALRTNLKYVTGTENDQVVLVTSSMSGEGKTFISINLCATLQLTGKKVILVEFDLRKPKIAGYFHLKGKGLTDYLITDINTEDIIQSSGNDGFDVITSGQLPPNPTELMLSPKIANLINLLKEKYDYIILDTAPMGLVTETKLLSPHADMSLYVIRQKFTSRHQIKDIQQISKQNILAKLNLILNDVKAIPGYGYGYDYY